MSSRWFLGLGCLAFAIVVGVFVAAARCEETPAKVHAWSTIGYPDLPSQGENAVVPVVYLRKGIADDLLLVVSYYITSERQGEEPRPHVPPHLANMTVRMHHPDGAIDEGKSTGDWTWLGRSRGTSYRRTFRFPWRENALEEAWVELRLGEQRLWLEVPYGFTRNPADAIDGAKTRVGPPAVAPAMKGLKAGDKIVPWLHVDYDLGEIQNGWRLSLQQANLFDAESEIVLYRGDHEIGKSMFLWELHTPKTSVAIKRAGDRDLIGRGMSIRLHDDGYLRSDTFKFNRDAGDGERGWGTMAVTVDDKQYECVLPSSLFLYVHGHADIDEAAAHED